MERRASVAKLEAPYLVRQRLTRYVAVGYSTRTTCVPYVPSYRSVPQRSNRAPCSSLQKTPAWRRDVRFLLYLYTGLYAICARANEILTSLATPRAFVLPERGYRPVSIACRLANGIRTGVLGHPNEAQPRQEAVEHKPEALLGRIERLSSAALGDSPRGVSVDSLAALCVRLSTQTPQCERNHLPMLILRPVVSSSAAMKRV